MNSSFPMTKSQLCGGLQSLQPIYQCKETFSAAKKKRQLIAIIKRIFEKNADGQRKTNQNTGKHFLTQLLSDTVRGNQFLNTQRTRKQLFPVEYSRLKTSMIAKLPFTRNKERRKV